MTSFRYKRDYYINDASNASDTQKRHSYGSSTSKSPSLEPEDVSDDNLSHTMHDQHDRKFLLDKLLNSNFDSLSTTSRNSRDSSERDFSIPKEILKQFESQMLHSDLKRESFRARNGTKNFCLNPLFEEGFNMNSNDDEIVRTKSVDKQRFEVLPSTSSSISSLDNCVESIFLDLHKIRRSGSVKSVDSDKPSFAAERCHSLKRSERKLK